MKPLPLLALLFSLATAGSAVAQPNQIVTTAQAGAPAPQLILNGDQWVIQVPANSPVPRSIVLQLASPTSDAVPTIVLQQPPLAQQSVQPSTTTEVIYADAPPPEPPREVIPLAPDRFHVWIGGHYEWRRHGYVWVSGRYERPPHRDARWAPARWEIRGGRYFYVEGRWMR